MRGELLGDNITIEEAAKVIGAIFEERVKEMRKEEKQKGIYLPPLDNKGSQQTSEDSNPVSQPPQDEIDT